MNHTYKRLAAMFLALTMALSCCVAPTWATKETSEPVLETQSVTKGTCGDAKWEYDSDTATMTIYGTGAVKEPFKMSAYSYFAKWTNVKTVIVKEGITSVPNLGTMFSYCTRLTLPGSVKKIEDAGFAGSDTDVGGNSLTWVTIGKGVTEIEGRAFRDCQDLERIDIPDTVTSIGPAAFYGCKKLKEVSLPDGLTLLDTSTFAECKSLENITIPNSVTAIEDYAFEACEHLTSIAIPSNVTSIGEQSFAFCRALNSVSLPDGLETIGDEAFYGCSKLKSVEIPKSVTDIGDAAFGIKETEILDDETGSMTIYYVPGFTIYGYTGSAAEDYAVDYDLKFSSVGKLSNPSKTSLKNVKAKKGKKIEIKWTQGTDCGGYELQYSTNKKFKKGVKSIKIKSKYNTSATVKGLKAKKKYYFRVRTVMGSLKSGWSKVKSAKAKK